MKEAKTISAGEAEKPVVTMLPVRLLKNYRPAGEYKIVTDVPAPLPGVTGTVLEKDASGKPREIGRKLWAGTVVELPREEVIALLNNQTTAMEPVPGDDGKPKRDAKGDIMRRPVTRKFPLAERMDALPV